MTTTCGETFERVWKDRLVKIFARIMIIFLNLYFCRWLKINLGVQFMLQKDVETRGGLEEKRREVENVFWHVLDDFVYLNWLWKSSGATMKRSLKWAIFRPISVELYGPCGGVGSSLRCISVYFDVFRCISMYFQTVYLFWLTRLIDSMFIGSDMSLVFGIRMNCLTVHL